MITIIEPGFLLGTFEGKCNHCGCKVRCDKTDTTYNKGDPDEPWNIACPQCRSVMSVFPKEGK